MQSRTVIAFIIGSMIIGFTYFIMTFELDTNTSQKNTSPGGKEVTENNVVLENGKQIINLSAKGGYQPRISVAKAGMPTVLRVTTNNTFDCSSAIRIPSLKIAQNLTYSGSVDFDLGSPEPGVLDGLCSMGMYRFQIQFKQ